MSSGTEYDVIVFRAGESSARKDSLVTEVPLTIRVGNEPLTVTMQTPGHELELATGLLFTEGFFKGQTELPEIKIVEHNREGQVTALDVVLHDGNTVGQGRRSLLSISACGICGKTEIQYPSAPQIESGPQLSANFAQMMSAMQSGQSLFQLTGGCHAAAAFDADGVMLVVREDIGRHNATDKVIGELLISGRLKSAKFLLVSGRVSYEIIAKAFAAKIPVVAAVSAPSSLAVDFSKELGITLLGFCREDRVSVYSHPERILRL